jgi:hypothetical protein
MTKMPKNAIGFHQHALHPLNYYSTHFRWLLLERISYDGNFILVVSGQDWQYSTVICYFIRSNNEVLI